jgi:Cof subfamily protein (haloacid dehalogenase superfamily)
VVKLLAIDVDGTLLDSRGKIPQDNLEALTAAVSRGTQIVIVTGRSYSFALPAVVPLPDPLLMIVHNGAIARVRSGETVLRRLLPRESARAVLAATLDWRSAALLYFDRAESRQILTDRLDWTHPNRARFRDRNRDIIEEVAALEGALDEDPIQLAFNGELLPMRDVLTTLTRHPLAADLSVSVTEYPHRNFSLIDVCGPGTTKGQTLARVAATLGIARGEVMAVGDNHNDRDMLEWAGVGVVMGNASEDLRSLGLEVTGTNDECGLATAVLKHLRS